MGVRGGGGGPSALNRIDEEECGCGRCFLGGGAWRVLGTRGEGAHWVRALLEVCELREVRGVCLCRCRKVRETVSSVADDGAVRAGGEY